MICLPRCSPRRSHFRWPRSLTVIRTWLADAFEVLDSLPLEMLYFERAPRGSNGFAPGTKRLVAEVSDRHGLAPFLVFDYLQKLDAGHVGPKDDERMKVSRSSAAVAELTRELGTTTFVISSINRIGYRAEPSLDVFKETGSIEFDSDIAMLLRWPEKKPDQAPPSDLIELWVLKNRYGRVPTGPIQLIFDGRLGSFRSPGAPGDPPRRQPPRLAGSRRLEAAYAGTGLRRRSRAPKCPRAVCRRDRRRATLRLPSDLRAFPHCRSTSRSRQQGPEVPPGDQDVG